MNLGSRLDPIFINLPDATCDDCGDEVDVESYVDWEGDLMPRTDPHWGCNGDSYRFTRIEYNRQAWALYYRPEVP